MTHFRLLIPVCICIISLLIDKSSPFGDYLDTLKNEYGEGYGTDWIYFPDADGTLNCIDLTMSRHRHCEDAMTANKSAGASELGPIIVTPDDITYRLFNRNATTYILMNSQGRAVNKRDQDTVTKILRSSLPMKILTHGWHSSADSVDLLKIKNAYLLKGNVNAIIIDWSPIAKSFCYERVANVTSTIGAIVAEFLNALKKEYNVTGDQLHLIGHSLGAHVVGSAAAKTDSSVYRVTGLDPARLFYEYPDWMKFESLNASDAEIVDIIHTCAGLLGFQGAIGTVDFFPNEGKAPQPGCDDIIKFLEGCSHSICKNYFYESILNPTIYPAYECNSWQDFLNHKCNHTGYMGEAVTRNMTGKYYLTTFGKELSSYHYVKAVQ